ncbi:MAG: glycosyltransferase family 4 protein [Anaerolineae bacterium]|nr:glycosyltransferase family 4 protein [Anaerolineae bacterium]
MKIIQIVARLNVGGVAVQVILADEQFRARGLKSRVVCGQVGPDEGDMSYLAAEKGTAPHVIPELGRALSPARDLATLVKLWRLLRRERPDVVHTHTAKAGFVGRLAARLAGVPVVVHTFHGHVFRGYFGPAKTRFFIALEQFGARLADRIVTLTEGLKRELVGYGIAPAAKFAVIPLGLELAPLAALPRHGGALRRELGLDASTPLVGAVGRLAPVKHLDLLLDAAACIDVQKLRSPLHIALAGDGECRPALEAQARALGIVERVHFLGWRDTRALPAVYGDLDVLVMSSHNEGMPVSIIEAMAAGVPVVATAVGGVPDLVTDGQTGALVPPDDAGALAGAVTRVLTEPAPAQRMADAARRDVLERFSPARLADDLTALYTALLERA